MTKAVVGELCQISAFTQFEIHSRVKRSCFYAIFYVVYELIIIIVIKQFLYITCMRINPLNLITDIPIAIQLIQ